MQHMGDTFRHVAVPALALGAGTGALSGFLSSSAKPGETGRDRRHRILRNAIIGAALGTTAGVGIPMGWQALNTPLHTNTAGPIEGAVDTVGNAAMRHPLPIAAAGGALWGGTHLMRSQQNKALDILRSAIYPGGNNQVHDPGLERAGVRNMAATNPMGVISDYLGKGKDVLDPKNLGSHFHANELMQEAGQKGISLSQLSKPEAEGGFGIPEQAVREQFLSHMGNQGVIGKFLSGLAAKKTLPFAEQIAKVPGLSGLATKDPIALAEGYSKYFRPSVARATGRMMPMPLKLGLLGASVLGANELQKRLTGS